MTRVVEESITIVQVLTFHLVDRIDTLWCFYPDVRLKDYVRHQAYG